MFNFFKKSKESDLPIKRGLEDIAKLNPKNYGVTILFNNQVLFQILQSKHFMQFGFEPKEENSFVEVHFFNKNKTNTIAIHDKFKSGQLVGNPDRKTKRSYSPDYQVWYYGKNQGLIFGSEGVSRVVLDIEESSERFRSLFLEAE